MAETRYMLSEAEAISKIMCGEKIENARIEKLSLAGQKIPGNLSLVKCEIDSLDLRDTVIEGDLQLDKSVIEGKAIFGGNYQNLLMNIIFLCKSLLKIYQRKFVILFYTEMALLRE